MLGLKYIRTSYIPVHHKRKQRIIPLLSFIYFEPGSLNDNFKGLPPFFIPSVGITNLFVSPLR